MGKIILLFFILVSLAFCGGDSGDLPENPTDEEQPQNPEEESSLLQFFSHLEGKYKGTYKNTVLEMWIERTGQLTNGYLLSVLLFEQNKISKVQEFLTKYQDIKIYSDDVCKHIKDRKSSDPETIGEDIWDENDLGGWGLVLIPADFKKASSFDMKTQYYIQLPVDDDKEFSSLDVDNKGQAIGIELDNTDWGGVILDFFGGSNMELGKISSSTTGLLNQYYRNVKAVKQAFIKAEQENHSYCD